METENYLFSVDGPNGIGKGGILQRARVLLEAVNFLNFAHYGTLPFRTASITEPPQLPLYAYASHPSARMSDGKLLTWRNLLKEGYGQELLNIGAPDAIANEVAFAEGFLTSRSIIERYMFEEFPWTFGCELNPFINMLPNIFSRLPGGNKWYNIEFDKVVIKDRGSASTAVFQGVDPRVREMMTQMYQEGDLMPEDLTVLLLPENRDSWIHTLTSRTDDKDVHDGKFHSQADRYFSLRKDWSNVFSRNIVEILNDPSGETNKIEAPVLLLSLLFLAYRQNGSLNWFDENSKVNSVIAPLQGTISILERVYYGDMFTNLPEVIAGRPRFEFEGLPISLVSGDIGLISPNLESSVYNDQYNLIVMKNLSKIVTIL